ncbi:MAG: hypothetical protein ACI4OY_07010 [Aristaeellaceae bacterium]
MNHVFHSSPVGKMVYCLSHRDAKFNHLADILAQVCQHDKGFKELFSVFDPICILKRSTHWPVKSMLLAHQAADYAALNAANMRGSATVLMEFMPEMIPEA